MNKAETIAYAIKKECQTYSLVNWCEEWGFTVDDFYRFLEFGKNAFKESEGEQYEYAQIDCPMNQKECDENCVYYNKLLLKCPMKVKGNGGEQE